MKQHSSRTSERPARSAAAAPRAAVVEKLEKRQLMHAVLDLRLAGGGTAATVTTVGQKVEMELWATVTGHDNSGANEGFQSVTASFLSTNITGGAVNGTLVVTPLAPFNGTATQNGTQADLDGDGDLDVGSNDPNATAGFMLARANAMVTNGTVNGASQSFKIASVTFTATSLLGGVQTNVVPRIRAHNTAFTFREDGTNTGSLLGAEMTVGSSVVLKREGTASVQGRVFNDKNATGFFDGNDTGIDGFRVFFDEDFDGVLDAGEISKPVSSTGTYTFSNVPAGTYRVREVFRQGWRQSFPALGYYEVTLRYGDQAKSQSFANTDTIVIKGKVFMDADKDKVIDAGEPGLAGWYVYIDTDKNGLFNKGDNYVLTGTSGNYRFFNLPAGNYQVRIVQQARYQQTTPAGGWFNLNLDPGGTTSNKNFGQKRLK